MPPTFHAKDFIARLGKNLIKEFEDARQATTGPLIGTAIETPARRRLEQVLPRGIAVGSGCVVDSYGNCSKQQDVVLYERDVCPVFSVNDTPESTYYPCEGVLGVIEVKSSLDTASLRDSFEKTESVRRLRRHGIYGPPSMRGGSRPNYRRYESTKMANRILSLRRFSTARARARSRVRPGLGGLSLASRMLSACGLDRRGFRGFTVTRGYCFWIGRRPGLAFRCRLGLVGGVGGDGEIEFPLKGCAYCPLVRGNLDALRPDGGKIGSIPAWAGEPGRLPAIQEDTTEGLSPRGRGNPLLPKRTCL